MKVTKPTPRYFTCYRNERSICSIFSAINGFDNCLPFYKMYKYQNNILVLQKSR